MTELPDGWRMLSLNEVAHGGLFNDGDWVETKDQDPQGSVRLTQLADVGVGEFRDRSSRWLREDQAADLHCTFLQPSDVLIARMPEPIGRACLAPDGIGRAITAVDVAILRVNDPEIDPRYIMWAVNNPKFHAAVESLQSGTTRKRISRKNLASLTIPIPALPEQRRIVDILEDHLSRLDAAGSALTTSGARLKRFHQASLDACVQAAAKDSSTSTTTIGSLAKVGTGATPLKSRADYYAGGDIPWITSGDLSQGLIQDATHFVTPVALKETAIKLWPVGTLLVAMYGEGKTRGTTAELGIEATTNQACAAIQMHDPDQSLKSWIRLVLESNYWSMRRMASGGVQPNLNLGLVRGIEIPVPAPDTQERLLRARDGQVEAEQVLAGALVTSEDRSLSLRSSLLAAAFSGRLTGHSSDMEMAEEMAGV